METAKSLRRFPSQQGGTVIWELGSEIPYGHSAGHYRLRVFQVASNGQCAVELRFNNNQAPPDRAVVEFSIHALPSDLDRLADLLERFAKLEHTVMEWNVTDGELREDVRFGDA